MLERRSRLLLLGRLAACLFTLWLFKLPAIVFFMCVYVFRNVFKYL